MVDSLVSKFSICEAYISTNHSFKLLQWSMEEYRDDLSRTYGWKQWLILQSHNKIACPLTKCVGWESMVLQPMNR